MNIEEGVKEIEKIKEMFIHLKNYGWINDIKKEIDVDKAIESIETLLTAYEKEKEKNKELRNQLNTIKDIYYNTNDLEELSDVLGVLLSNLKEE